MPLQQRLQRQPRRALQSYVDHGETYRKQETQRNGAFPAPSNPAPALRSHPPRPCARTHPGPTLAPTPALLSHPPQPCSRAFAHAAHCEGRVLHAGSVRRRLVQYGAGGGPVHCVPEQHGDSVGRCHHRERLHLSPRLSREQRHGMRRCVPGDPVQPRSGWPVALELTTGVVRLAACFQRARSARSRRLAALAPARPVQQARHPRPRRPSACAKRATAATPPPGHVKVRPRTHGRTNDAY